MATHQMETQHTQTSLWIYLCIFAATCVMEFPFYFLVGKTQGKNLRQLLLQTIGLNLATHPFIFWVLPWIGERLEWKFLTTASLSEFFAFAVETALLRFVAKYSWGIAILASGTANVFSWWFGLYLRQKGLLP
jgi:hypothetical protein